MTEYQIAARDAALAAMPEEYDTSEGSVFWAILSAAAIPWGNMLDIIADAIEQQDPINLDNDDLDIFVARYGMTRELGHEAEANLTITLDTDTAEANVPQGTLFETEDGLQFEAVQDYEGLQDQQQITVSAIGVGLQYNVPADAITVIPVAVEGIAAVTNPLEASGGVDDESDAELLERWQIKVGYIQTGYNRAWYEQQALECDGVGYAKCYAAGETIGSDTVPDLYVYVVVLDEANTPLTEESLAAVQAIMDPDALGIGAGTAPPTAHCLVVNGTVLDVTVSIGSLTISADRTAADIKMDIDDMLQQLMGSTDVGGIVRASDVVACIRAVNGVVDVDLGSLAVNGALDNIVLAYNQSAALAEVTYGTVTSI